MKILKTFENYENAGPSGPSHPADPNKEEINEKIKVIINNIIKVKTQFKMLKDTTEHVHELMMKQFPKSTQGFIGELESRDDILAEMVETIYDNVHDSEALAELEEIIRTINEMEEYTEDNLDVLLNQENDILEEDDYDDIEYFEDDKDADEMDITEIKPVVAKKKDMIKCPICLGTGEDDEDSCELCGGTGEVLATKAPKFSTSQHRPTRRQNKKKQTQSAPSTKKQSLFKKGDVVKIISGALKGNSGNITEVKNGKYFIGAIGPIPQNYLEKI